MKINNNNSSNNNNNDNNNNNNNNNNIESIFNCSSALGIAYIISTPIYMYGDIASAQYYLATVDEIRVVKQGP